MTNKKPNIIYINSHDTGRYVKPYGYDMPSPNYQKFAEEGMLFRQTYCANPTCSPSRACLLTGKSAHSAGQMGLVHRGFVMPNFDHHLVTTLKQHGYKTAITGIQHVARDKKDIGYDYIADIPDGKSPTVADATIEYLNQVGDEPFYLELGFSDTHTPFAEATEEDDPRYVQVPAPLPDTPEIREDVAQYRASLRNLDAAVGRILQAVDDKGLRDNTLIVLTTDHGIPFPFMKCNLKDPGIAVLLMIRGPKGSGFDGGKVTDALVSQIDIFPTICDVIGIEKPEWLEGKSLMPLTDNQDQDLQDHIFAEVNVHAAVEPKRCVRSKRFKYIRNYFEYEKTVLPNTDHTRSKQLLVDNGWSEQERAKEELYDLYFDPNEGNNLIDNPKYSAELDELRNALEGWMKETNDPLLEGRLPLPDNCLLCDPHNYDNKERWEYRGKEDENRAFGVS